MKILLDGLPLGDVPAYHRQPGEFFPRLVAVDVSNAGNGNFMCDVCALYIPVLRFQRRAGQVLIEINWNRPHFYITLQRRKPFFHIFTFPWRLWDREEP